VSHSRALSYVQPRETAYPNDHTTQHHSALALAFQRDCQIEIRGGGKPYSNLALNADRKNGPAARSFPTGQARGLKAHADAHDRIMVRINRSYRIQVCSTKMCPNGELASDSQQTDRHQPDTEVRKKPVSQFIIAPRAQASRRCETQAH